MTRLLFPFFIVSFGAVIISNTLFDFTASNVINAACQTEALITDHR